MKRRRHHARRRGKEAALFRTEGARRLGKGAYEAARAAFGRYRHRGEGAVAAQPLEGQRQGFAPRPVQDDGIGRIPERAKRARRVDARRRRVLGRRGEPGDAPKDDLAILPRTLEVGDRPERQAFEHALHGLGDELCRVTLGKRRLAKPGDFFLVARLRGAASFRAHPLGEVARVHHQHPPLRRIEETAMALHREGAAVLATVLDRDRAGAHPRAQELRSLGAQALGGDVGTNIPGAKPQQLLARIAEERARRLVEVDQSAGREIKQQHHVGRGIERRAKALQRAFALLPLGDVLHDRDLVLRPTLRIARERDGQVDPEHRAVLAQVALFELHRADVPGMHQGALLIRGIAIFRMRDVLHRVADQLGLAVTEHLAELAVDPLEAAGEIDVRDARGGDLEGLAKAHLAFLERQLGALAPEELADLGAQDPHGAEQPLVRAAHARARDRKDADDAVLEGHREDERAVHPGRAYARQGRGARVLADVGAPHRFGRLPDMADESLAWRERHAARLLGKDGERTDARAPHFFAANHVRRLVDAKVASAIPVAGLADLAHHGAQRRADVARVGEAPGDGVLERDQALVASAPGDVAADAAVAEELARGAEHRLAADREKALLAVGIDAADLEITERLARIEGGPMRCPAGGVRVNRRQLPARSSEHRRARRTMLLGMRGASHAMLAVGLPVEVRGELDQAAKARFALAQRLLGALLVGDVAADAAIALEAALGIEHRLAADRKPARAAFGRGPLHLEVAERLMTLEARAVVGPIGRREIERRLVPATPAEIRRRREAGLVLQQRRHEGQPELGILLPIPVGGELGQLAKALLALLQRLLGALVRADVADDAEHLVFAAHLVAQRHDARLHPTARAAQTNDLELQAAGFAAGGALRQGGKCRAMLGRDELEQASAANRRQRVGLGHAQAGRVHVDQPSFAIEHGYALRLGVDDGAQAGLARAQRMHDARLQRRETHRTLEGALAELSLD